MLVSGEFFVVRPRIMVWVSCWLFCFCWSCRFLMYAAIAPKVSGCRDAGSASRVESTRA